MTDATTPDLSRMFPGFDFFKGLAGGSRGSGSAAGFSHWIAPTVNVEELERRISEMKAVQFWLEQSLLGLKATVQALEVQKMTLTTLRSMNLNLSDVAKAFTLPGAGSATGKTPANWPFAARSGKSAGAPATPKAEKPAAQAAASEAAPAANPALLDPMQWWGALTQQFQQIAAETLKEAARQAPLVPAQTKAREAPAAKGGKTRTAAPAARKTGARAKAAGKITASAKSRK
jgi:hypothetical protein